MLPTMDNGSLQIKFDLLENGLDFASSGMDHILKDDSPNSLKYAILHLSAGVELILKAALLNEHWSLIFENNNSAKFSLLMSGDFKSADFESIISRLQNICNTDLHDKHVQLLRDLRKLRNKMEHFSFQANPAALKTVSSKVLSFLLNFLNANFASENISDLSKEYIEILRSRSPKFKEFVRLRHAQIKNILVTAAKKYVIECCPLCRQKALILDDQRTCAFCGYSAEPEEIALAYAENILGASSYLCYKDGGDFPVTDCLHCGAADTFVDKGDEYICFSCFESSDKLEVKECPGCGQMYQSHDDDAAVCNYCVEQQLKEWD